MKFKTTAEVRAEKGGKRQPSIHRSVIMIESMKQFMLFGYTAGSSKMQRERMVEDWTDEDTAELKRLVGTWDETTGKEGIDALLDNHKFSHGTLNQTLSRERYVQQAVA